MTYHFTVTKKLADFASAVKSYPLNRATGEWYDDITQHIIHSTLPIACLEVDNFDSLYINGALFLVGHGRTTPIIIIFRHNLSQPLYYHQYVVKVTNS